MRRRRGSSKSDIIIDLTSLLDVIFIILLVVLCGQSSISQDMMDVQAGAEQAKAQAEAEYKLYEDQREMADSLNQLVCTVSVMVPYDTNEVTKRTIQLLVEGEEIRPIALIGNNVTDAVEEFKECLISYILENSDRPVILSLNEDDDYILYRDEVMVNEIFAELAGDYDNVYIKGSISEEAE